jgi:hypothetical protein
MQLPRIDAHLSPSHFLTFSLSHFLLHHSNTSDGRRWSVVCRANAVIPACPESDGAERFTTKPPRHQGKNNREDGEVREERPILWEASPDADTAEGREKNISPQRSQRTRRNTDEGGAFLAPSALFGAAWAARRKASQLLSLMNILLNSKFKIQNL